MPRSKDDEFYTWLGKDFSIEKKTSPGRQNTQAHIHDQYELLLSLSDGMWCEVDNGTEQISCPIRKNTLLLFNNMDRHFVYPRQENGENIRYVVYFDPTFIASLSTGQISLLDCFLFRPFPQAQLLPLSPEDTADIRLLLDKTMSINAKTEEECYGRGLHLRLLLAELLLTINTLYRIEHQITTSSSGGKYRSVVYAIISHIHANYDQELSLDLLAGQFYINKYYLCELFKLVTGQSPNQYIINYRLMKAKELLRSGSSVEDACARAGFNNMSHFSRTFKSRVGLSPKQYQKEMRQH